LLTMIKEIGIFVVIAQAILYFVPGEHYTKYVKVLVGLMIIAKILIPVVTFFSGDTWGEIVFEGELLEGELIQNHNSLVQEDAYRDLIKYYSEAAKQQSIQGEGENGKE